jgi:hypothetical protein
MSAGCEIIGEVDTVPPGQLIGFFLEPALKLLISISLFRSIANSLSELDKFLIVVK